MSASTWSSRASARSSPAGGSGGHGNKRFANSTRQAPRFAERGLEGHSGWIELRLKLLADAGLIGLPNAGKSSLLGRLTRAAPKVADYPFTTLAPVLGTLEAGRSPAGPRRRPRPDRGRGRGRRLGHEFLAHVERCRALVHVVAIDRRRAPATRSAYEAVRAELGAYGAGLERLPELVALSKRDLVPGRAVEEPLAEWRRAARRRVLGVVAVSAATGAGLESFARRSSPAVPDRRETAGGRRRDARRPEFEAEHITLPPAGDQGYAVEREDEAFRVAGAGSSCWSPATTSPTRRRSPTSSSA